MSTLLLAPMLGACSMVGRPPASHGVTARMCLGRGPAPEPADAALGVEYMIRLVTAADSRLERTRVAYRLPPLPASAVSLIVDEAICRRAADAYAANALAVPIEPVAVYVVRVGPTRYHVWNPGVRGGEYVSHVIFSEDFRYLAGFTG